MGKYVDVIFSANKATKDAFPVESFRLVTDSNFITKHLLEVVHTHLHRTRGPIADASASSSGAAGGASSGTSPSMVGGGALGLGGDGGRGAGLGGERELVLEIFKEVGEDEENGMSMAEAIQKGKQRGLGDQQVRNAAMGLQMDGLIYSTVDDDHFRCVAFPRGEGPRFLVGGGSSSPLSPHILSLTAFFLRLFLFAQGCLEPPCSLLFFGVFGQSAIHFYCPSIILAHSFSAFPGALIVYHLQQKGGWARAREEEEK